MKDTDNASNKLLFKRTSLLPFLPVNKAQKSNRLENQVKRNDSYTSRRPVSLDAHFNRLEKENIVKTVKEHMRIVGHGKPNEKNVNPVKSAEKPFTSPAMANHPEIPQRPVSEIIYNSGNNNFVLNLPILHQSRRQELATKKGDYGTIRRTYEIDKKFNPVSVQSFQQKHERVADITNNEIDYVTDHNTSPDLDLNYLEDDDHDVPYDHNIPISPFPPVENVEVAKHKLLNEIAEQKSKSRPDPVINPDYLKRLKLQKRLVPPPKIKEVKQVKRKPVFKRIQTKPKWTREVIEDMPLNPEPPSKPKEDIPKPGKLILGFRYSHAIEEYYRGKISSTESMSSISSVSELNDEDEVKGGWLVKNLGARVLNLQARSLPSCNPIEIRIRRHQARLQATDKAKHLQRLMSRDSVTSLSGVKTRESFPKLHTIDENSDTSQLNSPMKDIDTTDSLNGDTYTQSIDRKSVESKRFLPDIVIERIEEPVLKQNEHKATGYDLDIGVPTKSISLNLPVHVLEE